MGELLSNLKGESGKKPKAHFNVWDKNLPIELKISNWNPPYCPIILRVKRINHITKIRLKPHRIIAAKVEN